MNLQKKAIVIVGIISVFILLLFSSSLLETNKAGYYKVKQASVTGKMTVRNTPGTYFQMFGAIHEYQISDMYYFSKSDLDGGKGKEADPIKVRFNDGGTAKISGAVKYRLSQKEESQLMLHQDFKSYVAVQGDLIRQVVTESLMQTATLMKAEESYSTRRAEFTSLAEAQIKEGIYETFAKEYEEKDVEGNKFIVKRVKVLEKGGKKVVRKKSPFNRYGITVLQFVIKDIDFDKTIDSLIAKKKKAEQQKVVAKANAEKAKQDAITVEEQGKALIAEQKAKKLVEKIAAVTDAQKKFEVAEFQAKEAKEIAKKIVAEGRAEAEANRLKVQAGLTPQEKAEWQYKTSVGVAEQLAKIQFPKMMILGGNQKGSSLNPFDAIGLESFIKISDSISKKK